MAGTPSEGVGGVKGFFFGEKNKGTRGGGRAAPLTTPPPPTPAQQRGRQCRREARECGTDTAPNPPVVNPPFARVTPNASADQTSGVCVNQELKVQFLGGKGMRWNALECVGMCWNVVECVGMCWNMWERWKVLEGLIRGQKNKGTRRTAGMNVSGGVHGGNHGCLFGRVETHTAPQGKTGPGRAAGTLSIFVGGRKRGTWRRITAPHAYLANRLGAGCGKSRKLHCQGPNTISCLRRHLELSDSSALRSTSLWSWQLVTSHLPIFRMLAAVAA